MISKAYILKNASIIDHNGDVFIGKDIYISDGIIKSITDNDENLSEIATTIDCSSYFITPGLVNLHTHSPMNIFKGIAEDVDIDTWFNKEIWPYESKMMPEDVYSGAILGIMEMIDSGVTAFADHYFCAESIIKAVLDTGIRGDIAPTLFGMAPNFDEQLSENKEIIYKYNNKYPNLKIRFGPHSPYTCSKEQLLDVVEACKELEIGMHIHVSETNEQVENSIEKYGKTPVELLNDIGAFDVDCIIAHGLWINPQEIKFLNSNCYIGACPKTYMKLSMGEGHLWEIAKKINLAIGSDGAASSNSLAPVEQVRLFGLQGKHISKDATDFNVEYLWKAMMNGHNALDFNSGKIEVGFNADLLIWDLNKVNTLPTYNPLASIIYSSNNENIIYNMVGGKFLKENGKLNYDIEKISSCVKESVKGIISRGKGKAEVFF